MAFTKKTITSLVLIVRQHAVVYGGGISSADAATREECDNLIDILEELKKTAQDNIREPSRTAAKTSNKTTKKTASKIKKEEPHKTAVLKKQKEPVEKDIKKEDFIPRVEPVTKQNKEIKPGPRGKRKISAVHLFEAFKEGKLPQYGGYIISAFFDNSSTYTIIEIVGYDNVREIRQENEDLIFKSAGCKLYALVEPAHFPLKNVEPCQRDKDRKIPYRFSELNVLKTKNTDIIYIGKKPIISYASFTILKPRKTDFSVLFYNVANVFQNMQDFILPVINKAAGIPKKDALRASKEIVKGVHNFHTWLDL